MPLAYICPYFKVERRAKGEKRACVICEAAVIFFSDKEMRREFAFGLCAGDYYECPIYKAQTAYYQRNESRRE